MVVGREPDPPYNRPDCSKGYLQGKEAREEAFFRPNEWWEEQEIELLTRTSVTALDLEARTAKLSSKQEIEFGKALIATGANVRRLNVDGCHLEQIHYLRTLGNADAIREGVADAEEVVLIGGSYIGCEVAASLTLLGKHCTIVMQEQPTLERGFGAQAGRFFQEMLQAHGVTVHGGDELERFEGEGRVAKVVTSAGLELAADAVVVGAGVSPDVQLAQRAGLEIGERGGVHCSSRLESSVAGVFAAGDICEYESPMHRGSHMRIEHWDVAFNHGKTAALNMLGMDVAHTRSRTSTRSWPTGANSSTSGPPMSGTRDRARLLRRRRVQVWYLRTAWSRPRSRTALRRPRHARRLIIDGRRWTRPRRRRSATRRRSRRRPALTRVNAMPAWDARGARVPARAPLSRQPRAPPKPVGTRVSSCEEITRSISPYSHACSAVK